MNSFAAAYTLVAFVKVLSRTNERTERSSRITHELGRAQSLWCSSSAAPSLLPNMLRVPRLSAAPHLHVTDRSSAAALRLRWSTRVTLPSPGRWGPESHTCCALFSWALLLTSWRIGWGHAGETNRNDPCSTWHVLDLLQDVAKYVAFNMGQKRQLVLSLCGCCCY